MLALPSRPNMPDFHHIVTMVFCSSLWIQVTIGPLQDERFFIFVLINLWMSLEGVYTSEFIQNVRTKLRRRSRHRVIMGTKILDLLKTNGCKSVGCETCWDATVLSISTNGYHLTECEALGSYYYNHRNFFSAGCWAGYTHISSVLSSCRLILLGSPAGGCTIITAHACITASQLCILLACPFL